MTANLVTSPLAEGLFEKAIFQSTGSLPTPGTPLAVAEAHGEASAKALGLPNATAAQVRALPAERFLSDRAAAFGLRTIIDGVVKSASIMETFEAGEEHDVLLMLGANSDEGRLVGRQRIADLAEDGAPVSSTSSTTCRKPCESAIRTELRTVANCLSCSTRWRPIRCCHKD